MRVGRLVSGIVLVVVVLAVVFRLSTPDTFLRVIALAWTPHYLGADRFPRSDAFEVAILTLFVPSAILGAWLIASASIPAERASSSTTVRTLVAIGWIVAVFPMFKAAIDVSVWSATTTVQTSILESSGDALAEGSATNMLERARNLTWEAYGLSMEPPSGTQDPEAANLRPGTTAETD